MDGQHHLQHVELARILYINAKQKLQNISIQRQWYPLLSVVPVVLVLPFNKLFFSFVFTRY